MWVKWLHHHCHLGGSQRLEQGGNHTHLLGPRRLGGHMWAKWLHNTCRLGVSWRLAQERYQKWLHPCRLTGLHVGKVAMSTLRSQGSQTPGVGRKAEEVTQPLPFFGAHKWAKWLYSPLPSRGSPVSRMGRKSKVATSPLPRAPHVGKMATQPLLSRGSPKPSRARNHTWLLDPCRLGAVCGQKGCILVQHSAAPVWQQVLALVRRLGGVAAQQAGNRFVLNGLIPTAEPLRKHPMAH